jgi:hypothetical protein
MDVTGIASVPGFWWYPKITFVVATKKINVIAPTDKISQLEAHRLRT